ncbi:uncharacterized protein DUF4440 [Neolewinella xylanilytica]|uniref:Uncharacterized protein DUF4440 n=1 Tax=Neolewinella xylanilytica TaxID=1514080 RepID=A0A2S6I5A4_9BACT|nr:nuclear transport factor 2 family protein [Neolewinella xylanilytica]PPK86354.1 uncharacterized protein DUF4440 [Neolewinella xylanilytica]
MKNWLVTLFCAVWLYTCGPPQDKSAASELDQIEQAETVFTQAYQELDAAVMDRVLADDYTVEYPSEQAGKSRRQWIGELQGLRSVFPALRIEVDSSEITAVEADYTVTAKRTFIWNQEGTEGRYAERYTNYWQRDAGRWRLYRSRIAPEIPLQ